MIKYENLIRIEMSLKHRNVVKIVSEASRRIEHKLPDVTSFEHTCYVNIGDAILSGYVENLEALARRLVKKAEARHLRKTKYEAPIFIESLARQDEEGNENSFEIEDVLANVEEQVLSKFEIKGAVELLAQNDRRKEFILKAWTKGLTNDTELSFMLAHEMGGKDTGHRRFIQRFKKDCQKRLCAI